MMPVERAHPPTRASRDGPRLVLGLAANRRQFWLLVLVNAFVGAMVGLERTVLPLLAEADFGVASRSATLSFVAAFGIVKAITNLMAGRLADRYGRRWILIIGWLFAIPVPLLVIWAPTWGWVVAANVLLGINQGLSWSTTVIMKIDLVGPRQRGLAMGLNEFAGYLALACVALATGLIAERFGLRPEPFYLGIAIAVAGLAMSVLLVRETQGHSRLEASLATERSTAAPANALAAPVGMRAMLRCSVWSDPAISSTSQVGLVNNLNDGLAWGLFPLYFAAAGLGLNLIGVLVFVYPASWGVLQLVTGALSDRIGRKPLIVSGMLLQALALIGVAVGNSFWPWLVALVLLGAGTAMVYPTLLAAISDVAHPSWRGSAIGIYRFWRDSGYVVGALLAGILADQFGIQAAIAGVAALTLGSGILAQARMPETLPSLPVNRSSTNEPPHRAQ